MSEENPKTGAAARARRDSSGAEAFIGRVLADRYVLKRQIGRGGFGIVFEAEDRRLGRRVAAKVLLAQVAKNPGALARFEIEAKAAAQIGHQGIVDVRDFGSDAQGTHFIIMELIDGVDLAEVIRDEGPLPLVRCLSIAARVAQALAVAHDHGIIHRDLKPANILLTRIGGLADFAKVLDFGISKISEIEAIGTPVTETGTVVGTPRYMAPEQGIGTHRVDHRVDIYALGIILYEMATRDVPFTGNTPYETLHLKASVKPRSPSQAHPTLGLPAELDTLLLRALQRSPDRRFASMWAFDVAIRKLLKTLDPSAAALVEPTPVQQLATPGEPAETSTAQPTAMTKAMPMPRQKPVEATLEDAGTEQPRSRRRAVLLVAVGCAAVAIAVLAVLYLREEEPTRPRSVPVVAPQPLPAAPDANAAPDAVHDVVELRLDIEPSQATVELDGVPQTQNPLRVTRGPELHQLTVAAPGFVSISRSIPALANDVIVLRLEKARRPQPASTKPPPSHNPRPRFPDTPIEPK